MDSLDRELSPAAAKLIGSLDKIQKSQFRVQWHGKVMKNGFCCLGLG